MTRVVYNACLADIDNLGDALFPLLVRHRLGPEGFRVVAVSPSGRTGRWTDSVPTTTLRAIAANPDDSAGMLIGGGNIIIGLPASRFESLVVDLWLGATGLAVRNDIPIIWNTPGVPRPFLHDRIGRLAHAATRAADRVAVRDTTSRAFLGLAHGQEVDVAPDTAIDLAAMWPRAMLRPVFRDLLARKGARPGRRFMAFHARGKGGSTAECAAIGTIIDAFAERGGIVPILIAIGPGTRDDVTIRAISRFIRADHIVLDDPGSMREMVAALAFSSAYVGQSLHGCIAAASYGVPGVLVSPPPARRFKGFATYRGTPEAVVPDWHAALALIQRMPDSMPLPDAMRIDLDRHWRETMEILRGHRPLRRQDRAAFMRLSGGTGPGHGDDAVDMREHVVDPPGPGQGL